MSRKIFFLHILGMLIVSNGCHLSSQGKGSDTILVVASQLNENESLLEVPFSSEVEEKSRLQKTDFSDHESNREGSKDTDKKDVPWDGPEPTTSSNADLEDLISTEGRLDAPFRPEVTDYFISVRYYPLSFQIIPTASDPTASITVSGSPVLSGNASSNLYLPEGISNLDIVVTASDGVTHKTYHLTVYRMTLDAQQCRDFFDMPGTLDEKLQHCRTLRDQIVWEEGTLDATGQPIRIPYERWSPSRKGQLQKIYQNIESGSENLGLNCPTAPQSTIFNYNWDWPIGSLYTPSQAFDIYAAHVAHALYLEINRIVPWSLFEHPESEWKHFFDSAYMFTQYVNRGNFYNNIIRTPVNPIPTAQFNRDLVGSQYKFRAAQDMVCDPRVGFRFLSGLNSSVNQNLIGSTETETLKNITLWFRDNVKHAPESHWRSPDHANTYLYLEDRLRQRPDLPSTSKPIESPVGCHTAASLFYDLARSVNLAVTIAGYSANQRADRTVDDRYSRHSSLVYRPYSGPNATRVILHVDSIYTLASSDEIFAIDPSSEVLNLPPVALTPSQKEQLFFDLNWVSLDKLRLYGFVFSNSFQLLERGVPYANASIGIDDYRTDGVYLGYFPYNALSPSRTLDSLLELEKNYQLCSYSSYLADVCASNLVGYQNYFNTYRYSTSTFPISLPSGLTSTDYYNHGRACIAAHGGCDSAFTANNRRQNQLGITSNYWVDH